MSEDQRKNTAREDDLGELFQLFQLLADASNTAEDDTSPAVEQRQSAYPASLPLFSLHQPPTPTCIRCGFLRHAQCEFHLPLKINDDVDDEEMIPFLAFVSLLRGEELSMHSLSFFRISTPLSDDDAAAHGATPQNRFEDSLRRRTLAITEASGGASQMDSVRTGRKKTLAPLSHRSDDTRDAAHRAFMLLERLYNLLASEIENLSSAVVLPSTTWTERHPRDPKDPRNRPDRSIAKAVFPVQFRKKRYSLAEVEELIGAYERRTTTTWGNDTSNEDHQKHAGASPGHLSKPGDNVKFIGNTPLPKLNNAFISKSADEAVWGSSKRRRSNRSSSVASDVTDADSVSPQKGTQRQLSVSPACSPCARPSVVAFAEDVAGDVDPRKRESLIAPSPGIGTLNGDQFPQPSPESRRASSLPALRASPASEQPPFSSSPVKSSKLAEVYHQRYPKIPANFKRKFHSELSDRLYEHVRATSFDKLTLSKPYFMPVEEKLDLRERFKAKGAMMCREDLQRNGFCYSTIPWLAAKALEGLDQVQVARSLSTELEK